MENQKEYNATSKIQEIANYYGVDTQVIKLAEEASELIQAICKHKNGMASNVIEEIADVSIMIKQVIYLFDCEEEIAKIEQEKIKRQLKRIYEEKSAKAFLNRF